MTESEKATRIERVRVLHGHTDPESAYVKDDHPYGSLRCQIRYWIETTTKGSKKGQWRFVQQTTNPKRPGHPWNKPHPKEYYPLVVMYLDAKDHVQWWGVAEWIYPARDARFRLMGLYDQLTDEQRHRYDVYLKMSKVNRRDWGRFEDAVTALAAEIARTGKEPEFDDRGWTVWETPSGQRFSLGDPIDVETHLAAARQRLDEERDHD